MSVELEGLDEAIANIGYYYDATDAEIEQVIRVGALSVEADAVTSIQRGAKTGKIYQRGNITHQSSAPGEAPATDTGNLVQNIKSVKDTGKFSWLVGTGLKYGRYLEHGTTNMKPRPWLIPALEKNRKNITEMIQKATRK